MECPECNEMLDAFITSKNIGNGESFDCIECNARLVILNGKLEQFEEDEYEDIEDSDDDEYDSGL